MNKKIFFLLCALMMFGCAANGSSIKLRQEYINAHLEISSKIKHAILEGKVIKGMTKADVLLVWGKPSRISSEISGEGWFYDQPFYSFFPKKSVSFTSEGIVYDFSVIWGG